MRNRSDSVRKDYKTMNEIHKTTKPQSKERIKELEEFVKEFETPKNLDLKEEIKKWNISINSKYIFKFCIFKMMFYPE